MAEKNTQHQPNKGGFHKSIDFHVTCLFDHASEQGLIAQHLKYCAAIRYLLQESIHFRGMLLWVNGNSAELYNAAPQMERRAVFYVWTALGGLIHALVGAGDGQINHLGTAPRTDGTDLFLHHGGRFGPLLYAKQIPLVDLNVLRNLSIITDTDQRQ